MRPATAAARAAPLNPRCPSSTNRERSPRPCPVKIPKPGPHWPFDSSSRSIPSSFSPPPKLIALTPLRRGMGFGISTFPLLLDLAHPNQPRRAPFPVEDFREKLKKLISAGGGTPFTVCFDESLPPVPTPAEEGGEGKTKSGLRERPGRGAVILVTLAPGASNRGTNGRSSRLDQRKNCNRSERVSRH